MKAVLTQGVNSRQALQARGGTLFYNTQTVLVGSQFKTKGISHAEYSTDYSTNHHGTVSWLELLLHWHTRTLQVESLSCMISSRS